MVMKERRKTVRQITIKDLAAILHTTPSTVSRALRDEEGVGEVMRNRVKELARKMNYRPNAVAAGLRKGNSHTVGVIVPRINRDFFSGVIAGIEEIAYEAQYNVIICQTHDSLKKEEQHLDTLLRARVDGILVSIGLETKHFDHFEKVLQAGIPLIFFDRVPEEMSVNRIRVDDRAGAREVVQHMIDMGYRNILHFAGPDYLALYHDRKEGYLEALEKNGIPVREELIIPNSLTFEEGQKAMENVLKQGLRADALFSASDYSALGALLLLQEKGIRIPEEFGVAGFSNEKFTSYVRPSLTTVDQQSKVMGKHCMELFLREVNENNGSFSKIMLRPEVLLRDSTRRR